jgi:hypothetical protein
MMSPLFMERLSDNIFNCGCGHFNPRASITFVAIGYSFQ